MNTKIDLRRILIFLAFAYGIAWLIGLFLYLNGGLTSPLAFPMLTFGYMMAPAAAHALTRLITREGWQNTGLRPNFRRNWPFYAIAWFLPAVLVIAGGALYYLVFPQHYDPNLTMLQQLIPLQGIDPWLFVAIQVVQGVLLSPVFNSLFTFGEEFGWRGYLLPKLMPLGARLAMVVSGIIWGAWHWPITIQGHNYGLDYPGYPYMGMLAMVWMTFVMGIIFSWLTLRSGSVWPAVIGHGAMNGIGGLTPLFIQGQPNPLLGPSVAGLLGGAVMTIVALVLLFHPHALAPQSAPEEAAQPVMRDEVQAGQGPV